MNRSLSILERTLALALVLILGQETLASSAKRVLDEENTNYPPAKRVKINGEEVLKNDHITKMDLSDDPDLINIDFIRFFPNLRDLNLQNSYNLKNNYQPVSQLTKLERLNLYDTGLTTAKYIRPLINLVSLTISCENVEQITKHVIHFPNIKELIIHTSGGNINSLTKLSKLISLENLTLRGILNNDEDKENFSYPSLDFIASLTNLKKLDLSNNDYIFYIKPLTKLSKLTHLNLSGCKSIRDLYLLKNIKSIIELNLNYITPFYVSTLKKDLNGLKKLSNLKKLIIDSSIDIPMLSSLIVVTNDN